MFSVAFSGPAGSGVNTSALIVAFAFSKFGYKILFDKEYQSIIK
jgi:Pyruvate/2-oxoacid:ferredoxin oxidoreductase gamma subunit